MWTVSIGASHRHSHDGTPSPSPLHKRWPPSPLCVIWGLSRAIALRIARGTFVSSRRVHAPPQQAGTIEPSLQSGFAHQHLHTTPTFTNRTVSPLFCIHCRAARFSSLQHGAHSVIPTAKHLRTEEKSMLENEQTDSMRTACVCVPLS